MRNVLFSIAVCVIFVGPALLFGASLLKIDLPSWMTSEDAFYISGKTAAPSAEEALSIKGFVNKDFQQFTEAKLSEYIPMKASGLLGFASLQRSAIDASNMLLGFDCYPTYFGSGTAHWPEKDTVITFASTVNESNEEGAWFVAESMNEIAKQHPDVNFIFQQLDDTYSSEYNPTNKYISNTYSQDWIYSNILEKLDGWNDTTLDNFTVLFDAIESEDEFGEEWYHTEHHWRIGRAIEAYNQIAEVAGLNIIPVDDEVIVYPSWHGAYARTGLDFDFDDYLEDVNTDFSDLSFSLDGSSETPRGLRGEMATIEGNDPYLPYNAYHTYYGNPIAYGKYTNSGENNGKKCLFVTQSYGAPIERYIAANYEETIVVYPLNCDSELSLVQLIEEEGIDEVIMQCSSTFIGDYQRTSFLNH